LPDRVETIVAVLGTGTMAPGIAAAAAAAGGHVRVLGRREEAALAAGGRASALAGREVAGGLIGEALLHEVDLVIETVAENVEVKRTLLERIEAWIPEQAIIVTNTSSLPLPALAAVLRRPGRFAGLHFLNPAEATSVVEIVRADQTDDEVVATLVALAARMGKRPIVLDRPVPGFIWNRLQFALLRECLALLADGVADASEIDAAVSDGLAPRWLAVGPLGTADLGGLGTFRQVCDELFPLLAADGAAPAALSELAQSGGSFYDWTARSRAEVEALRADALAHGRALAERRAKTGLRLAKS
jgi:3-hydroxybutyryl-CoA dehydrogenase